MYESTRINLIRQRDEAAEQLALLTLVEICRKTNQAFPAATHVDLVENTPGTHVLIYGAHAATDDDVADSSDLEKLGLDDDIHGVLLPLTGAGCVWQKYAKRYVGSWAVDIAAVLTDVAPC